MEEGYGPRIRDKKKGTARKKTESGIVHLAVWPARRGAAQHKILQASREAEPGLWIAPWRALLFLPTFVVDMQDGPPLEWVLFLEGACLNRDYDHWRFGRVYEGVLSAFYQGHSPRALPAELSEWLCRLNFLNGFAG